MAKMKAVCIDSFGGPERLLLKDIEVPVPDTDELLIQIRAASVNPVDAKTREGKFPPVKANQLPKVLGRDVSGTVVSVGSAVTRFKKGDEVYAMLDTAHGGYAEYVALNAEVCASKPKSLNHVEAAAVPLAAMTAWQGLFDHGQLRSGQRVLIHGGAGGVGHFAIQFAKARGANVSTTVSGSDKAFVRSLGADQVIDHHSEHFEDVVDDVDLVLDLVAGDTQKRSWSVLKKGGTLVSTLAPPSEKDAKDHEAHGVNFMAQPNAEELAEVGRLIDAGKVRPWVEATFSLHDAAAAQEKLERGHVAGKIVLEIRTN
jgi:NADPH:quinone reductase-like Zn-dependent oxidoreductase